MVYKRDIRLRQDVERLVIAFYGKVAQDGQLSPFFEEKNQFKWTSHLPRMVDFWDTLLLGSSKFKGNLLQKHVEIHSRLALSEVYFDKWLSIWKETVIELYKGETADKAIETAENIKEVMWGKIKAED